jgi:hypothetical protein
MLTFTHNPGGFGTSLQGYVKASYDQLVKVFGDPTYNETSGDDKVDFEWVLKFNDGTEATIYNWKDYDGGLYAMSTPDYTWHIGGKDKIAVCNVLETLGI